MITSKWGKSIKGKDAQLNIIYLVLFALTLVYIYFNCNYHNIWYDEGFSLHIIQHSYLDIWKITADDVHPPLYYWLLKLFTSITNDSVIFCHFFSSTPLILTLILTRCVVAKTWNHKTAILFFLLCLLHHSTTYTVSDIRMYSWAAFFVLFSFVFGWQYIVRKNKSSLILLTIFSVCAAYTHYYALISIFYIYIFLIIYTDVFDRKKIIPIIGSSIVAAIIYIPWLHILLSQVSTVVDDYWILDIDYVATIKVLNPFLNNVTIGLLFLVLLISYTSLYCIKNKKAKELIVPFSLFILAILPTATGIIISILSRPIFTERYLHCSILLFLLGLAILLGHLDFKKVYNLLLIAVFLVFMGSKSYELVNNKKSINTHKDASIKIFSQYIDNNLNENTAFVYRYKYHREMPFWTLIYSDYDHVCKTEPLDYKTQMLNLVPHKEVQYYSELPSKYKNLFYIDAEGYSLMATKEDSVEITRYYNIAEEVKYNNQTLFKLTRKE